MALSSAAGAELRLERSEMAHTPGPWESKRTSDGYYIHPSSLETEIADQEIALVYDLSTDQEEANARLIAAAPEMLATLKEAWAWLVGYKELKGVVSWVEQTIAKAEG